jgi:hypothetical protein
MRRRPQQNVGAADISETESFSNATPGDNAHHRSYENVSRLDASYGSFYRPNLS